MFGFEHWIVVLQVGTLVMLIALAVVFVRGWRRQPGNPVLLMLLATTLLAWQDPIMNWAVFAAYDPRLWHFPETWALVSLSPTVEPFIVVAQATFFMAACFPALRILRCLQARRERAAFVNRHPLISVAVITIPLGMLFDVLVEGFAVLTQLYIFTQVPSWGSFAAGRWYQFPLISQPAIVSLVMVPPAVLLYRDDSGRTQAERLVERLCLQTTRPTRSTFLVMFAVMNVVYLTAYGGGQAILKATKASSTVACPWPYPEAKVFDPQGLYERAGHPGPYVAGIWSGWPSGQPAGRPDADLASTNARCE